MVLPENRHQNPGEIVNCFCYFLHTNMCGSFPGSITLSAVIGDVQNLTSKRSFFYVTHAFCEGGSVEDTHLPDMYSNHYFMAYRDQHAFLYDPYNDCIQINAPKFEMTCI